MSLSGRAILALGFNLLVGTAAFSDERGAPLIEAAPIFEYCRDHPLRFDALLEGLSDAGWQEIDVDISRPFWVNDGEVDANELIFVYYAVRSALGREEDRVRRTIDRLDQNLPPGDVEPVFARRGKMFYHPTGRVLSVRSIELHNSMRCNYAGATGDADRPVFWSVDVAEQSTQDGTRWKIIRSEDAGQGGKYPLDDGWMHGVFVLYRSDVLRDIVERALPDLTIFSVTRWAE